MKEPYWANEIDGNKLSAMLGMMRVPNAQTAIEDQNDPISATDLLSS